MRHSMEVDALQECKRQRFLENDYSMKWLAQSFLNVDAISISRGGSQVARSIGEVPSRSKSAW